MKMTKMYVYCETHDDWHIVGVQGLKEDCVIICGHTIHAGMHDKLPSIGKELAEVCKTCENVDKCSPRGYVCPALEKLWKEMEQR